MIDEAVLLAAGKGTRIRSTDSSLPKPLQKVAGQPLIKRTILTLARAGVTRVTVVLGFMGREVRQAVAADAAYARAGVEIAFVDNPEYEKANGISVLCARPLVRGPFVLSMADHVFEPEVAAAAAGCDPARADLWLCVDRRVSEVYDIDDATKVRTEGDLIRDIGKDLATYDCVDCGVFAVTSALFDSLDAARADGGGDCSLSDGVRRLAGAGRARVVDIGDAFWQDVDTPGARARAEQELLARTPAG
jgi:1L-myo-inositol 1-phosphate cytidylyltransferase